MASDKAPLRLIWLLGLFPLLWLGVDAVTTGLGANPIEKIHHRLGDATLIFLLATLAVTPLARFSGRPGLMPGRRTLGLLAFGYATLHLINYVGVDQFFDWGEIAKDIAKRRYITAGITAYLLLLPLALTSTKAMMRRLGKRWKPLHRLVYPAAVIGVIHFIWLVKKDLTWPLAAAALLALLLGWRLARPRL